MEAVHLVLAGGYEEVIKRRKRYWDSLFQKFASVTTGEDYLISDIINKSNNKYNAVFEERIKNSQVKKKKDKYSFRSKNTSQGQIRQIVNYSSYKKNKPDETYEARNSKTYRKHILSEGINKHVKIVYEILLKSDNKNLDFYTFLWVKSIIEEDSNGAVEELLKDKNFTRSKIMTLVKVLPKEDVLKYFRFYLQYIRLQQYAYNNNIDFPTFLWVKNTIEEHSGRDIEESLKDKGFTRNKIITLANVLPQDDVLKYFRFYMHYFRLHQ